MPEDKKNQGSALSLGTSAASAYFLLAFGGNYLDKKFDSGPFYTLLGVFLATIWMFYEVWKIVRKNGED